MDLIVAVVFMIVFSVGIIYVMKANTRPESDAAGLWVVLLFTSASETLAFFQTTFPYTPIKPGANEHDHAGELEDEAASLAMFCIYDSLRNVTADTIIQVRHAMFGTYTFKPDYEEGHLIGVELVSHTPAGNRPATKVAPRDPGHLDAIPVFS